MLRKLRFTLLYFGKPRWDTGISPPELLEFIRDNPTGRALDLGCGTGTNAITLAQNGWVVTGIDFVKSAIHTAQRKAKQAGVQVEFHTGDVTRLDLSVNPFDLILDIGCLHSLPPESRTLYINNLDRLLAPSGTYLLYAFVNSSPDLNTPWLTESDLQNIQTVLQLNWRKDGTDHHQRQAAWFSFSREGSSIEGAIYKRQSAR